MNRDDNLERLQRARRVAECKEFLTEEEMASQPMLRAREMARAEERRNPQPQLSLPGAT